MGLTSNLKEFFNTNHSFNFKALFRTNPLEQIKNNVRKMPLTSLGLSLGSLAGLYLSGGQLGFWPSLFIGGTAAAHIGSFYKEYKGLFIEPPKAKFPIKPQQFYDEETNALLGELRYEDNFPTLYVDNIDSRQKGKLLANVFQDHFIHMMDRFIPFLFTFMKVTHVFTKHHHSDPFSEIKKKSQALNINYPRRVQDEIEGFTNQMNHYISEHNKKFMIGYKPLTVEDMKVLCAATDIKKLFACTSLIAKNTLLRNLDYPSAGFLGDYSLIIVEKNKSKKEHKPDNIASFAFMPGLMHTTITNGALVIALNEAARTSTLRNEIDGIPKLLFIHKVARSCKTLEDFEQYCLNHKPLSPCTLTLMENSGQGAIYHMLPPGRDATYMKRSLGDHRAISAANHFEDEAHVVVEGSSSKPKSLCTSHERQATILNAYLRTPAQPFLPLQESMQNTILQQMHFNTTENHGFNVQVRAGHGPSSIVKTPVSDINISRLFYERSKLKPSY